MVRFCIPEKGATIASHYAPQTLKAIAPLLGVAITIEAVMLFPSRPRRPKLCRIVQYITLCFFGVIIHRRIGTSTSTCIGYGRLGFGT